MTFLESINPISVQPTAFLLHGCSVLCSITTGLAVAAGASGIAVAAKVAQHHGLIPPDAGGLYGPGETLTYAARATNHWPERCIKVYPYRIDDIFSDHG